MTNGVTIPVFAGGKRLLVGVSVQREHDGSHTLSVYFGGRFVVNGALIPKQGLGIVVDVAGVPLPIRIAPARGHLISFDLALR